MYRFYLILNLIAYTQFGFCQLIEKDTVFIKSTISENKFAFDTMYFEKGVANPPVLVGTTVLTDSRKNYLLQNNGLKLEALEVMKGCRKGIDPKLYKEYPKFNSVKKVSNKLIIDVSIVSNCCHEFLGEAEILGSDTLNLIYTAYGSWCSCSCCYELRYTFDASFENNYNLIQSVIVNNNKNVIGRIKN